MARPRGSPRQTCLCRAGSGASSSECGAASPDFSFRPCVRGAGASEGASGRFAGAEARDAPGGSTASRGVAGDGRVAVRGAAAGPVAPGLAAASGRAVGAATPRFGRRDPQPPSRAAAAETQREPGPSARGPGLEEAGRGGGKSGATPAQVRDRDAGGRERATTRVGDRRSGGWSAAGAAAVNAARRGDSVGKAWECQRSPLGPSSPGAPRRASRGGRPGRIWREGGLSANRWVRAVVPKDPGCGGTGCGRRPGRPKEG